MTSMHFYGWKKGLKTGQYYLRTQPSRDAIKFTVDIEQLLSATDAGDNDEILKCLTLAKQASKITLDVIKAGTEEEKREERFHSIVGTEEEQALAKKQKENKENQGSVSSYAAQEVEETVFECLNCGS